MNDETAVQPVARWFTIAAIASVLFMVLGCAMYLMHVLTDPAGLPPDQRAAYIAVPAWAIGAFGVATWVGALGALMLALKRKLAEPLLLVSLIAVVAWLAAFFLVPDLRDAISTNDLVVPIAVTIVTWTIFWFARHSRQRGWLR
jgi:hypothetical protein